MDLEKESARIFGIGVIASILIVFIVICGIYCINRSYFTDVCIERCEGETIPLHEQIDYMTDEELKDFIEHVRICDSLDIDQYKAFRYLLRAK